MCNKSITISKQLKENGIREGYVRLLQYQARRADTGTPLNVLHRMQIISQYIVLDGKRIHDCGCGRGEYLKALARYSNDIFGVEYDHDKVNDFHASGMDCGSVKVGNVESLEFADNTFDFILMNEVLDHVANEEQALREVFRVLKPGGMLALFTPNRLYPFETHDVGLKATGVDISHMTPFIPYIPLFIGKRFFVYFARNYWPWQLKAMVRSAGFDIVKQTFAWQTFENNTHASPNFILVLSSNLRKISFFLEKTPILKVFGVSLSVIAKKGYSGETESDHAPDRAGGLTATREL